MQNKSGLETLDEEINEDDNMVNGHGENNHSLEVQSTFGNDEPQCIEPYENNFPNYITQNFSDNEDVIKDKIYFNDNKNNENKNNKNIMNLENDNKKENINEDKKAKKEKINENFKPNEINERNVVIFKVIKNKKNNNNDNIISYLPHAHKYLVFRERKSGIISSYLETPIFKIVSSSKDKKAKRKYNNDDIYKKLRGKIFHFVIKKLNNNLKKLNIKFQYAEISQNSKIEVNEKYLISTVEEVLKTVEANKKAFEKLEKENTLEVEIKEILNAKVKDIYKEYFNSEEFQESIKEMHEEKEENDEENDKYYYIYLYIQKCKNCFNYYNIKIEENNEEQNKEEKNKKEQSKEEQNEGEENEEEDYEEEEN